MGIEGMFENFWFELAKSFAYGVILALLGHVLVTFWRSVRGGAAAIPRLRLQFAELFQLRRDNETGRTSFGPWLVARDLIRIAVFIAVSVVIGLVLADLLMRVISTDQTLQQLDQWGTITLKTVPIPVPVFACAFLLAFFLAYLPGTGRVIGTTSIFVIGVALFLVLILLFRWLPFELGRDDFHIVHALLGGVTRDSLMFSMEGGNWFMPSLHVLLIAASFLVALVLSLFLLGHALTLLPDVWREALSGSLLPAWATFLIGVFGGVAVYFGLRFHFVGLTSKYDTPLDSLDIPRAVALALAIPACIYISGKFGKVFMLRLKRAGRS